MKVKFVYFDIGGVLVNHIFALKQLAKDLQIEEKQVIALFDEYRDRIDIGSLSWSSFEKIFYERLKPDLILKSSLVKSFVGHFKKIEETHVLIYILKNKFDIGILSNVSIDVFEQIETINLIPKIDYKVVIKSAKLGIIKPSREIFEYACDQLGVLPEEILFIDDSLDNVEMAKLLGWKTVLFKTEKPVVSVKEIKDVLGH